MARALGIARANAYQALEGLARRGAARRAATKPSLFTATPPAQVLVELERAFQRDLLELVEAFNKLPAAAETRHEELQALESVHELLAGAVAAADAAASELLVVTGPWAQPLHAALERATARGASVRAISLGTPAPKGATVREVPRAELTGYWGGFPIALVSDRSRAIWGVLGSEGTASGIATTVPGAVPFIRHLLRRELASAGAG